MILKCEICEKEIDEEFGEVYRSDVVLNKSGHSVVVCDKCFFELESRNTEKQE